MHACLVSYEESLVSPTRDLLAKRLHVQDTRVFM